MGMPFTPNQLVQMIKGGMNPQQLTMQILENQMSSTPMGANLLSLAKSGKGNEIEQIARNICNQRGVDFDKEFTSFKQMLGL